MPLMPAIGWQGCLISRFSMLHLNDTFSCVEVAARQQCTNCKKAVKEKVHAEIENPERYTKVHFSDFTKKERRTTVGAQLQRGQGKGSVSQFLLIESTTKFSLRFVCLWENANVTSLKGSEHTENTARVTAPATTLFRPTIACARQDFTLSWWTPKPGCSKVKGKKLQWHATPVWHWQAVAHKLSPSQHCLCREPHTSSSPEAKPTPGCKRKHHTMIASKLQHTEKCVPLWQNYSSDSELGQVQFL